MRPRKQRLSKTIGEPLRFVEAVEDELAKGKSRDRSVDRRKGYELTACREEARGDKGVEVRMKVAAIRSERLNRSYEAGYSVVVGENFLEARLHRLVGPSGEATQERPLPLEQPPQGFWDGEHNVVVRDRRQNLLSQLLGEERRALRDA